MPLGYQPEWADTRSMRVHARNIAPNSCCQLHVFIVTRRAMHDSMDPPPPTLPPRGEEYTRRTYCDLVCVVFTLHSKYDRVRFHFPDVLSRSLIF